MNTDAFYDVNFFNFEAAEKIRRFWTDKGIKTCFLKTAGSQVQDTAD